MFIVILCGNNDHKPLWFSSAVQRLKACDDAFRKQLEQERRAHEQHIQTLNNEKQKEIEQANARVSYRPWNSLCIHFTHSNMEQRETQGNRTRQRQGKQQTLKF